MVATGGREVLITEVTRMTEGMVCAAGIDTATGAMVRPLQPDGRNWEEDKWVAGHLHVGSIVRLTPATAVAGPPPHGREDFRVERVGFVRNASPAEVYIACRDNADDELTDIVGNHLFDGKYVDEGADCRSLGCLMMNGDDLRFSGKFDKLQVSWRDDQGVWHNLKLTDLHASRVEDTEVEAARLQTAANFADGPIALRIGLARPWVGPDRDWNPKRCTLQLNGLIFPA